VELHAHVPLLIASRAPCGGPDGLATGNGSAGITVAESASAAATIAADFIEIFSFTACTANSWRGLFPIIRIKLGHPLFGMTCTKSVLTPSHDMVPRSSLAPVQTIWTPRQNRIKAVSREQHAPTVVDSMKVYPNPPIREAHILELTAKARH